MITEPNLDSSLSEADRAAVASVDSRHIRDHLAQREQAITERQEPIRRSGPSAIRLLVVPAAFSDRPLARDVRKLEEILANVAQYYLEVSSGNVAITWQITFPVALPQTNAFYANGESGRGAIEPNAKTIARAALTAIADEIGDFGPFDTDGDRRIDGFVVVHSGKPAESYAAERSSLIWSHRGFGAEFRTSSGYLLDEFVTVSQESPLGVWCHELGHLLFNWPDISEGSNVDGTLITHTWCLMSSGGWNGARAGLSVGASPAHPCAPLKIKQGWLSPDVIGRNGEWEIFSIEDVNKAFVVSSPSSSRSLVIENRERVRYDVALPGSGLIIWDTAQDDDLTTIKLVPATGSFNAELRGTADDPFPGAKIVRAFERFGIGLTDIADASSLMHFKVAGLPTGRTRAVRHV